MMLERMVSPLGVVYYRSPALANAGVPHAFSTRLGGLSPKPFDSLNLGNPSGCEVQDDRRRIGDNYARLMQAIECQDRGLVKLHQVHGGKCIWFGQGSIVEQDIKADALATDDPAWIMSVRVADCVPVLIASGDGQVVAAAHAGWRGIVAGVVIAAVEEIRRRGGTNLVAAVGPCIGFDAFEVGPEVIAEFERILGPAAPVRRRNDGKGHVDCREAVRLQLQGAGVGTIDTTDRCSWQHSDEFYSHRREKGLTGRMAALISPRSCR